MTQVSVWVQRDQRDLLRKVFDLLADPYKGEYYRTIVWRWTQRKRPIRSIFEGFGNTLEVDAPSVGDYGYHWPIGGRVYGTQGTWIELSPEEVVDVKRRVANAVDKALDDYLREHSLLGKIRDTTGVAQNAYCTEAEHSPSKGDVISRPRSDDDFQENEDKIVRAIQRMVIEKVAKWETPLGSEDRAHIFEFESYNGIMSRCHLFKGVDEGKYFAAFGHIDGSLQKPTNSIEFLAETVWNQSGFHCSEQEVLWYDCTPRDGMNPRIARVVFDTVSKGKFEGPKWFATKDEKIPQILIDEMVPLLRKSKRHPDNTNLEILDRLAIFWQIQDRNGVLQFCSSECDMSELAGAFERDGQNGLLQFVKGKTNPVGTQYVEAYDFGVWPQVYAAMRSLGLPTVSLEEANRLDGRGPQVRLS